jgi:endonuclease/exonuclease/phosphatase family metal-dependent hydrolase
MRRVAVLCVVASGCERRPPTTASTSPSTGSETVRVVTWNVESLGTPGDLDYEATLAVLQRIDADVVSLNEVDAGEEGVLRTLADGLGYDEVLVAEDNPFGSLRNALLTRLPLEDGAVWTAPDIAGDPSANDLTRWPLSMRVAVGGGQLTVVGNHFKSGFLDSDGFRRAVDAIRTSQAGDSARADGPLVVCGDLNVELEEADPTNVWRSPPSDLPDDYVLGGDVESLLENEGLRDDPFAPLVDRGLVRAAALQRDGRDATRDSSDRAIDHVYVDVDVIVHGAEVYDARDEALNGLVMAGDPPEREATELASDHFPVLVDLTVSW